MFSIPELSQDFYRFIWDGILNNQGVNPYLHLPKELVESNTIDKKNLRGLLFDEMGELSINNYSTYPPVAQLLYSISYYLAGSNLLSNVVFLRLFNLLAEIGLVFYGLKMLGKIDLPKRNILLFILNPLVILESTFSLHFEIVMLFFLALSLYYLYSSRVYISALGVAAAIASKMLPLMFLPLIFPFMSKKGKLFNRNQILRFSKFVTVLLSAIVLAYSIFWDSEMLSKNFKTLSLYFTSFEFNASFYYALRWVGFELSGYNMIGVIGKLLLLITTLVVLFLSFKKKSIDFKTLLSYMLFASTAYYLFSTTVHPWYIMLPLFLSIFTKYRYMLLWSWLVFLSYSAYRLEGVEENYSLLGIQYAFLFTTISYEIIVKRKLVS
ncbi:glycosyltransferase ArnT-like protein [Psychroflexus salinarum]|uniref:Glycosyltransferase ArnT-like protein n=1 Tax=Psychroflexus salinarum TaxID=546024 RepID=A0ABW3GVL1_9FLAO